MMAKMGAALRETGNFIRTIWRVIVINWRVSPPLYMVQVVMTVVQGLLPLAIAYLTARLYDVDRGAVRIGGVDVRDLSFKALWFG